MAVNTALYSRDQQTKAQTAAARYTTWARGYRLEDGLQFVNFSSETTSGVVYSTHIEGLGCTCPRGKRNQRCWHALACQMAVERARAAAFAPKRTYEDLFGDDDLTDEAF